VANRNYSSVARATTTTAAITSSQTLIPIAEVAGYPTVPFTLVLDPGRSTEEAVTVTNLVGLNATCIRGEDGTGAYPHDAGASVRHMLTARDLREPAEHDSALAGVHGVISTLVGVNDAQNLDNKTFTPVLSDHVPVTFELASGQNSHMVNFSDSASNPMSWIDNNGRVNTPGVDSRTNSNFTTTNPALAPQTVTGAASQTAHLTSWKNSSSTELSFIAADGSFNGPIGPGGFSTVGRIGTPGIDGSDHSNFTTSTLATNPVTIATPSGHTGRALAVQDHTGADVAGILGDAGKFQMYQGVSANLVPYKMHGGAVNVTIVNGATSQIGTIDISGFGFDFLPICLVTAKQNTTDTVKRRVAANIEGLTSSTLSFRIIQTSNEPVSSDTIYAVHWMAIQFGISSSAG
jgi:hypothetical protein